MRKKVKNRKRFLKNYWSNSFQFNRIQKMRAIFIILSIRCDNKRERTKKHKKFHKEPERRTKKSRKQEEDITRMKN